MQNKKRRNKKRLILYLTIGFFLSLCGTCAIVYGVMWIMSGERSDYEIHLVSRSVDDSKRDGYFYGEYIVDKSSLNPDHAMLTAIDGVFLEKYHQYASTNSLSNKTETVDSLNQLVIRLKKSIMDNDTYYPPVSLLEIKNKNAEYAIELKGGYEKKYTYNYAVCDKDPGDTLVVKYSFGNDVYEIIRDTIVLVPKM